MYDLTCIACESNAFIAIYNRNIALRQLPIVINTKAIVFERFRIG